MSTRIVYIKNKDKVNIEETEKVGQQIQNGLDNCFYSDAKIKRSKQVTALESLQNTKATKDAVTMADPCKMFNRLITIVLREDDLEPMFEYELTFEPMSLFKEGLMRKPDKPALRNVIMPNKDAVKKNSIKGSKEYVLDGGALLHRLRWSKGMKFDDIAEAYASYIRNSS